MSVARGDSQENVNANRHLFLNHFNTNADHLAQPVQISRDGIKIVDSPGIYGGTDALITEAEELYLSVLTADCAPVLIWSSQRPVVASVHSGWQGSELNILGQTLQKMIETFDLAPTSLSVAIGPGLCKDNFEVGPEFSQKFPGDYLHALPETDRFHFDNNHYLHDTAMNAGVPKDQIEIMPFCSYYDKELFFSHRRDGMKTGRMMSMIGIHK